MKTRKLISRKNRVAFTVAQKENLTPKIENSRRDFAFFALGAVATLASTVVPAVLQRHWQYESETFFKQVDVLKDFHLNASRAFVALEQLEREYNKAADELWDYWVETGKFGAIRNLERMENNFEKYGAAVRDAAAQMQSQYILTWAFFASQEETTTDSIAALESRLAKWEGEEKILKKRSEDFWAQANSAEVEDRRSRLAKPALVLLSDYGLLLSKIITIFKNWLDLVTEEMLRKIKRR